jgi:hypothetical protein
MDQKFVLRGQLPFHRFPSISIPRIVSRKLRIIEFRSRMTERNMSASSLAHALDLGLNEPPVRAHQVIIPIPRKLNHAPRVGQILSTWLLLQLTSPPPQPYHSHHRFAPRSGFPIRRDLARDPRRTVGRHCRTSSPRIIHREQCLLRFVTLNYRHRGPRLHMYSPQPTR